MNEQERKISTKDYIDLRIRSVEDKIDHLAKFNEQHFELNELAIKKAEESMLLRLEGMNEFREQINKERESYATKQELTLKLEPINKSIKRIDEANAFSAGKMWMVMAIFAAIPTILALIALWRV